MRGYTKIELFSEPTSPVHGEAWSPRPVLSVPKDPLVDESLP